MTSDERHATRRASPTAETQPTNGATDPARVDLLDRYWDAVTGNGYQRAEAIAVDPTRARMVDRLHRLSDDHSDGIPADARARIWRATATQAGIPTRQESPMTSSSPPAGGLATSSLTLPASRRGNVPWSASSGGHAIVPGGGRPSQPTGRALWPRLQFAVAAVLILGLFATLLAPMDDDRVGLFGGVDSTPTTTASMTAPSIGYPQDFTGSGSLVDLPPSATGHTVSLDRVVLADSTTLTLPPGVARMVSSVTGAFTADRGNGSAPLTVEQPSQIDVGLAGGSVSADQGEDVTITVLTIAPEGTASLASSDGVTIYPLTNFRSGYFRFDSQQNVLFGNGPVPVDPEPVPPSTNTDDPQNFANPGTLMLLYAEQGSITITSPNPLVRRANSSGDDPSDSVANLTITQGEAAVVSNPSQARIQQTVPGQGAVYTVAFLSPPALDRTPGQTYPNTNGAGFSQNQGPITVPADGNDYRVVLDRLTLQPGAIAKFIPGTFRAVQWTGGGGVVMTVSGGGQTPFTLPNPMLSGSFQDQGFSLVATGDAAVTLTLMSYLPTGAPSETVAAGQDGVTSERLTAYAATNPSNATELQIIFSAMAAEAFPVEIDFGLGLNTSRSIDDSYALIRSEDGPITLNRPATRIVDGREATEIAAGELIQPHETVRVDDLLDATISGPTDGTPAGYTVVIVSPITDPLANQPNAGTPVALTGLTPASVDTVADLPADLPLDITLLRHTLGPGAELTVFPGDGTLTTRGELTYPVTVLTYVARGDGTVTASGQPRTDLATRSSELAMQSATTGEALTVSAGSDGLTVFQLIIGSGRAGLDSSGDVESVELGTYRMESQAAGPIDLTSTIHVRAMFRAAIGMGVDSSQNLGRDETITLLTPLDGNALIVPGVGDVRAADPGAADRSGAAITAPWNLALEGSVIARPGGQFRVAPIEDPLSYLWAEIEITSGENVFGTPVATPMTATPPNATPPNATPVTETTTSTSETTSAATAINPTAPPVVGTGPLNPSLGLLQVRADDAPTTVDLYRYTLLPNAELQIPASGGERVSAITYIEAGSASLTDDLPRENEITAGSPDHTTATSLFTDALTVRAGADGATLYQLVVGGSGWSGFAPGTTTSELLAGTTIADLINPAAAGDGAVDITAGMVVQEISTGPVANSTRTFGDDGTVTIFTPLTGDFEIRPNTDGVQLMASDGGADGTPLSEPATISPGTSIVTSAGATFDVVTPAQPTAYLMTRVSVDPTRDSDLATAVAQARLDQPAGRPAATPVPAR
jgi:hypothetical protein